MSTIPAKSKVLPNLNLSTRCRRSELKEIEYDRDNAQ